MRKWAHSSHPASVSRTLRGARLSAILACMNKTELLSKMDEANGELEELFASMTGEQISRQGVYDDLSPKDVLAHIAAWQSMAVGWLRETSSGGRPTRYARGFEVGPDTPEDEATALMDKLNAHVKAQNESRSFADVISDYRNGYRELVSAVDGMNDEQIADTTRFYWLEGKPVWHSLAANSYEHVFEHIESIKGWLALPPAEPRAGGANGDR